MTPLVLVAAVAGAVVGIAADRLSARWPSHPGESVRARDWRTVAVTVASTASFAALAARWADPRDLLVLGVYLAALMVLLATDLDQKLLPDVITLPLAGYALVVVLLGVDPLLRTSTMPLATAVVAGIGAPALLLLTDRLFRGGLGMGDVKLAVSLGLMSGVARLLTGFLIASVAAALVIVALMAAGRLSRRSAIPFGPILVASGVAAMLLG
jgi:leader peptidase (prepilin peptidase) / N-methyltransferase